MKTVRNPFPAGTVPVGAGLLLAGITAYAYLALAARALGPQRYAPLSVLWTLVVVVGPGVFLPLEQEIARGLAHRRSRGLGGGPIVRRVAALGVLVAAAFVAGVLLLRDVVLERLFNGDILLLGALVVAILGYLGAHLVRGTLGGAGRFNAYGLLVGSEGVVRVGICIVLFVLGSSDAGEYGIALGVAPAVAAAIVLVRERGLVSDGPDAPWAELSGALGYLLAGSLLAQLLLNAGPIAVKLLADADEAAAASRFLAGLVLARVPLFLFQAVQASLLPKLAGLVGSDRHRDFRSALARLVAVVSAIGAAATIGALTLGPWALRFLFGPGFGLGRSDLGYLAGASAAFMLALVMAQALIALSRFKDVVAGWAVGLATFGLMLRVGSDLLGRVERAFTAGAVVAAIALSLAALAALRRVEVPAERLVEAASVELVEP